MHQLVEQQIHVSLFLSPFLSLQDQLKIIQGKGITQGPGYQEMGLLESASHRATNIYFLRLSFIFKEVTYIYNSLLLVWPSTTFLDITC